MQKEIKTLGIIAAMDMEVEAICEVLEHKEHEVYAGILFYKGSIHNQTCVVMKSGVGKGNAAMSTTILLEHFHVDAIVNIGTAGGLRSEQNVLDAVVSTKVVQHDFDTSPIDGEAGIGMYFESDQQLAQLSLNVLKEMNVCAHHGLIASGDLFVARDEDIQTILNKFNGACCSEMEAGAIAQVASHYHVPFVVLRSLSDIAVKEDSHMDFMEYAKSASERSAYFTKLLCAKLA